MHQIALFLRVSTLSFGLTGSTWAPFSGILTRPIIYFETLPSPLLPFDSLLRCHRNPAQNGTHFPLEKNLILRRARLVVRYDVNEIEFPLDPCSRLICHSLKLENAREGSPLAMRWTSFLKVRL